MQRRSLPFAQDKGLLPDTVSETTSGSAPTTAASGAAGVSAASGAAGVSAASGVAATATTSTANGAVRAVSGTVNQSRASRLVELVTVEWHVGQLREWQVGDSSYESNIREGKHRQNGGDGHGGR
eukprot:6490556-Amphidinium_carterae.2